MPTALRYPPELPITARREDLLAAIGGHQVVVVAGETGSGKSTQLPKLCLELGRGSERMIAHTQPRRLAARSIAQRIADELGTPLGGIVGYAVRFDDVTSAATQVRLMTDGLLLAEVRGDRELSRYDTVIVDEAHERSLTIDFLLGYLTRLLPRRPDLKVVITSATIDPERFSAHFGGAPIVEVSGRTHPVEVRWQPLVDVEDPDNAEERDQADAVGDAVVELLDEGRGDVLVFLSGEREICDTADALRARLGQRVELLPLYARLAHAEQQRVFRPSARPRVVLATNVAETSLTVPGIRSVVDPGTARISRYSTRRRIQRLPIEAISRASADQRAGRCGRVAPGVCIRLYAEEDYDARPRFTEPEVVRTNLAAVILQMAALDLGEVEDFPFLDPPDRGQVRDGVALLHELAAWEPRAKAFADRLTPLGRRLARLPVDPRLGRMILEADRQRCVDEVIVIAAGLSIQDPRERPQEQKGTADLLHARFADPGSDFVGYWNLWRHLQEQRATLSGNAFRRQCKEEFLHHLRVREWQDLVGQLRSASREAGVKLGGPPAERDAIHRALLAGLLSHLGVKEGDTRAYRGARGTRFQLWPGSTLARTPPSWVMAAELVETTRSWGRVAARIDPAAVEPLAAHLVTRTYDEPRWSARRAQVVATERVTLYGLPLATRTVAYARIDPVLARELFIRRALVEDGWDARHDFLAANRRTVTEVAGLEARARRRDLLAPDDALVAFFDERLPAGVVSGAHFDRWWKDARRTDPDLLTVPRELLAPGAAEAVEGRPLTWRSGASTLRLSYRFEPGSEADGVTVHVPLAAVAALDAGGFDWHLAGFREELVTALLRGLPKELRREVGPAPQAAAELLRRLRPGEGPLTAALSHELRAIRGLQVPPGAWPLRGLPPHLRLRFAVEGPRRGTERPVGGQAAPDAGGSGLGEDADGRTLAAGRDLDALRERLRDRLREQLGAATPGLERTGLTAWTLGDLPRTVTLGAGLATGYPALADEGSSVGVKVLETPQAQQRAMAAGTRRLVLLTAPPVLRRVRDCLTKAEQGALSAAPHGSVKALLDDAVAAAADRLIGEHGGPSWDAAGFARLRTAVAARLADTTLQVVRTAARILTLARDLDRGLAGVTAPALQPARDDLAAQLRRLVHPGFLSRTGAFRLADVERYLRAAQRRLERLADATAADRERMEVLADLEHRWRLAAAAVPRGRDLPPAIAEVPWLLEELRVSIWAQHLGTREPVSAKRIRRILEHALPAAPG